MDIRRLLKIAFLGMVLFLYSCTTEKSGFMENDPPASNSESSADYYMDAEEDSDLNDQLDHNQCVSNGFLEGSTDYKDCRSRLKIQRRN